MRSTASARRRSPGRRPETEPIDFQLGDRLRLRKGHACGGFEWLVTRLGADIGLRCTTCSRQVLLERRTLEKRLKAFVSHASVERNRSPA